MSQKSVILRNDNTNGSELYAVYATMFHNTYFPSGVMQRYIEAVEPLKLAFNELLDSIKSDALDAEDQLNSIRNINETLLKGDFLRGYENFCTYNVSKTLSNYNKVCNSKSLSIPLLNIHCQAPDYETLEILTAETPAIGCRVAIKIDTWVALVGDVSDLQQDRLDKFDSVMAARVATLSKDELEFSSRMKTNKEIISRKQINISVKAFCDELDDIFERGTATLPEDHDKNAIDEFAPLRKFVKTPPLEQMKELLASDEQLVRLLFSACESRYKSALNFFNPHYQKLLDENAPEITHLTADDVTNRLQHVNHRMAKWDIISKALSETIAKLPEPPTIKSVSEADTQEV